MTLNTDITKISRVGAAAAKRLKKLGIETAGDLLFYFPFRYDDFSRLTPISELRPGASANIVGRIELIQNKRSPRKRMYITESLVSDDTGEVKVVWFNQPFIARNLRVGDKVSLAGKAEDDYGGIVMMSPVYEKITRGQAVHTQGLVPNYHLTANITQKQIRFLIKQIIGLARSAKDWLPEEISHAVKLLNLGDAIAKIHFPKTTADIDRARERLAFNELFLIQLQSQLIRRDALRSVSAKVAFKEEETKKFVDSLPFKLTGAQRKAAWEILRDMEKDKPMSRLLEGDVGSGKTVVAVIAMLNAALGGMQSVLMAPTEILARQHYGTICQLLSNFNVKIGLITRSVKKMYYVSSIKYQRKREEKNCLNTKYIILNTDIIIGTHALIQENVEFKNLALAIIDEQHRFGVDQRKALMKKNPNSNVPHLLSMTATPIPRSLALALYGDLDVSVIDEMPAGRKKVLTYAVPEEKREGAYNFIRGQIKQGRQVFVICPLIDISDKLGVKSVKEEFEKLDKKIFFDINIGFLHGKMKTKEKEEIMRDFLDNKIKILVSTSVVEVGVDVPNATIMMIESADRFGLAQLHQFRGRVGRSEYQSYCFLFAGNGDYGVPLSDKTLKRLQALVNCHNGFELAKMDLKFRGPGEVYGTAQKGFPELKIASLFDYQLMKQAQDAAVKLINQDASLNSWPELKEKAGGWEKAHLE
ncbi:ATP-dependent DNA helicase RecG [Patescibacteria group bacterium]|nr:ATP-dependent DNA helicase RecG [Patescibacteria group bacterium]MBU4347276.1 ATP-dependent DNA helicase RecG [Patescibacteria group bacterium]